MIVDLAHNEAGLDALLEVMHGLRPPAAAPCSALGTAGDRTDEIVRSLGEIGRARRRRRRDRAQAATTCAAATWTS